VKLIVGLGNPDREHRDTRHNVGFMVVDEIARRHDLTWAMAPSQVPDAFVVKKFGVDPVLVAKPLTYMNRSGPAASALARYYGVDASELLVVVDDIDLPFGRLERTTAFVRSLSTWVQGFPDCGSGSGAATRGGTSLITCSRSSSLRNASSSNRSSPGRPTPPRCSPRRASSR
jgi:hypothetical protein